MDFFIGHLGGFSFYDILEEKILAHFLPGCFGAFSSKTSWRIFSPPCPQDSLTPLDLNRTSTVGPPDKFVISVLLNLRYSSILFYIPGWLAGGWMCTDGPWCEADEGSEWLA